MTDFRALCAELLDEFVYHTDWSDAEELKERARAALAEEPAVPLSIADAIATAGSEYLFLLTDKTDQLLTPDLIENLYSQFHSIIAGLADNLSRVDEPAVPVGREPAAVTGRPSDEELLDLLPQGIESGFWLPEGLPSDWVDGEFIAPPKAIIAFARDVLELWGNPAPQPVPVSERLPRSKDCDAEGRCWWFALETEVDFGAWTLGTPEACTGDNWGHTHWLPAHALPLPGQEVEG